MTLKAPKRALFAVQSVQATSVYSSAELSTRATAACRRVSLIARGATETRPWLFGAEASDDPVAIGS